MLDVLEIMMSDASAEEKQEKLRVILKKQMQDLTPEAHQQIGAGIVFDRLSGMMDVLNETGSDIAFHAGMKATLAYVMAGLTRHSGIDGDLLTPGHGEGLTEECYAYIQERVTAHLKGIQEEHDRLELK